MYIYIYKQICIVFIFIEVYPKSVGIPLNDHSEMDDKTLGFAGVRRNLGRATLQKRTWIVFGSEFSTEFMTVTSSIHNFWRL